MRAYIPQNNNGDFLSFLFTETQNSVTIQRNYIHEAMIVMASLKLGRRIKMAFIIAALDMCKVAFFQLLTTFTVLNNFITFFTESDCTI